MVLEELQYRRSRTYPGYYVGCQLCILLVERHRHESHDVVKVVESYRKEGFRVLSIIELG
jgi:hypothetical protein